MSTNSTRSHQSYCSHYIGRNDYRMQDTPPQRLPTDDLLLVLYILPYESFNYFPFLCICGFNVGVFPGVVLLSL